MRLIRLGVLIAVVVGVFLTGSYVYDAYLVTTADDAQAVTVTIDPGSSVEQIAALLESEGVISSASFLKVYARLTDALFQAGTFELKQGMSLKAVDLTLRRATATEVQVTIPEGFTLAQIGEVVVESLDAVSADDWQRATGSVDEVLRDQYPWLSSVPATGSLEGYLFPDTYRFREDATVDVVIETMLLTFSRRLAEQGIVLTDVGALPHGMNVHEIVTLASIVEREVRQPDEMKVVAGLFLTRLDIGMALQADSTVNYVTGKDTPAISIADSRIESAYNTYQNAGLPPGPISHPGVNALMSVFDPTDSPYLYFLTDPVGNVYYAETFDQHIANKYQYLR